MDYYHTTPSRNQYYSPKNNFHSPTTAASQNYYSPKNTKNIFRSLKSSLGSIIDDAVAKKQLQRNAIEHVYSVNRELLDELQPKLEGQALKSQLTNISRDNEMLRNQIARLEREKYQSGNYKNMFRQLEQLKREGEQLRRNTIILLNRR